MHNWYGYERSRQFPIHWAVTVLLLESPEKAVELVKFLLTVNASVASQRISGTAITPLMIAVAACNASNLIPCFEVIEPLYNVSDDLCQRSYKGSH